MSFWGAREAYASVVDVYKRQFMYRSNLLTLAIAVTRSCVRNRFGEVKTEASGKPVPLHDSVREALIEWPSEFLQSRY